MENVYFVKPCAGEFWPSVCILHLLDLYMGQFTAGLDGVGRCGQVWGRVVWGRVGFGSGCCPICRVDCRLSCNINF